MAREIAGTALATASAATTAHPTARHHRHHDHSKIRHGLLISSTAWTSRPPGRRQPVRLLNRAASALAVGPIPPAPTPSLGLTPCMRLCHGVQMAAWRHFTPDTKARRSVPTLAAGPATTPPSWSTTVKVRVILNEIDGSTKSDRSCRRPASATSSVEQATCSPIRTPRRVPTAPSSTHQRPDRRHRSRPLGSPRPSTTAAALDADRPSRQPIRKNNAVLGSRDVRGGGRDR